MHEIFEELFNAWCLPYVPGQIPEYLQDNPLRAYGLYAFEEGFKLALQLAVCTLPPEKLDG